MPDASQEKDPSVALQELMSTLEKHPFGIITQKGYAELQDRIHRIVVVSLVIFGIMGLANAVALVGFRIILGNQSKVANDIQQQRYDSVLEACEDQNDRHDDVIKQIDDAVAGTPPPPVRQRRAKEGAKPFKLILEAAVPYTEDCHELADRRVKD